MAKVLIPADLIPQIEALHARKAEWYEAESSKHLLDMGSAYNAVRITSVELTIALMQAGVKPKHIRNLVVKRPGAC